MVTMDAAAYSTSKILLPSREDIVKMLTRPAVAITAIICGTLFALAALAGVVWLAYTGHETAAVGTLVGGPLFLWLTTMAGRLREVQQAVRTTQDPPTQ